MKKLWIISELFPPDETSTAYIMGEIANVMTQKYAVKVITGPEIYDKRKKFDPNNKFRINDGIEIFRVKTVDADKNTVRGKIETVLASSYKIAKEVKKHVKPEDKVLMVTNPLPLIVLMARLKSKIGFELNILVHDIFPENAKPSHIYIPFESIVKKIYNLSYSKADLLIALGRDMKQVLEQKTKGCKKQPRIEIIENWADIESIAPLNRGNSDRVVIEYAGNIGRGQRLLSFIDKIVESNNQNIQFEIYGTGALENELKKNVTMRKITNVVLYGAYFRSQQNEILNNCDIALVAIDEGLYGLGVPSKTYNIMAAGKPILFIGHPESEIALLIKEKGIGFVFSAEDDKGIITFLASLDSSLSETLKTMGDKARKVAVREYSKETILSKFITVI